ncbi:MAG TPA: AMP-binding protein, partial [Acidimicrobiia bacterium]|nr:AMP-binding protein [Acidimicrobiia bacterium]
MTEARGEIVWTPPPDVRATSRIGRFLDWLAVERDLHFEDYHDLWRWSVDDLDGFWRACAEWSGVRWHDAPSAALGRRAMPGAEWFSGATLNYAEQALAAAADRPDELAIVARSQTREPAEITWAQLADGVARCRTGLRRLGVRRGDRVAALLPNIPETIVAFLAAASLGAIWSSCAPEFGTRSVVDRFAQIEPTVLLAI